MIGTKGTQNYWERTIGEEELSDQFPSQFCPPMIR